MQTKRRFYIGFTLLFSVLMLTASAFLLMDFQGSTRFFEGIGVPPVLVFPIAMAQILGVILLWSKVPFVAKKWVYIGFSAILLFAGFIHIVKNDGFFFAPLLMGAILFLSYFFKAGLRITE